MSSERKEKVISAIVLLVVITVFFKIFEYFGGELKPDRTRSIGNRLQKSKQLQSNQQVEQIMYQQLNK